MYLRTLILLLLLLGCGCAPGKSSGGSLKATGKTCLAKAEAWLATPGNKGKLREALQVVREANEELKKSSHPGDGALIADLELLQGALNMAQIQVDEGKEATQPSSLSESTPTNAVTVAIEQLRTDLSKEPEGQPAP